MKLTKIKLINWHIFSNQTIIINGNTLITGENASGKSTLMDAVYYVLSGGDDKHFNKAANEMGKRDLESYLRGKLGSENKMYLRPQSDIIGYVMLEFEDRKKNNVVLGVELEIVSSVMKRPHFFIINHYSISDDDFIKDKQIVDYRDLKLSFKSTKHPVDDLPDTKKDRLRAIGRDFFKLDNYSRFYELLQHAISFKPIPEVSSFVNGFLLDEDNINLDSLRDEIRSYQNIHKLLLKEQEKINLLENFTPKAEKYISNLESMAYFAALKIAIKIDKLNNQIKRNNISIERYKSEYNDLINEEKVLREKENRLGIELYQLRNNEAYKALQAKKDKLKEFERVLLDLNRNLTLFIDMVNGEQRLARRLNLGYRFDEDVKSKDFGLLKAHLENYKEELNAIKLKLNKDIAQLEHLKLLAETEIKDKQTQLDNLKKGINNYPADVYNLIEICKDAIKNNFPKEKNPEVKPFCEYIEIKDEKWSDALEGYLNTQRFNLIIEPKFYDVVSVAYNKYKNERRVYVAGIVNAAGIPNVREVKNSMLSKIEVSYKPAKKYAEYLLAGLTCVEDVNNLKNFDSSITPEVMIYKNHVMKACKPEIYKNPFIGKASREKRLHILESEISGLRNKIQSYNNDINKYNALLTDVVNSRISDVLRFDNSWSKIDLYNQNIRSLKEEIASDEKEKGLFEIDGKIKLAENNLYETQKNLANIDEAKKNNLSSQGQLKNKVEIDQTQLKIETDNLSSALSRLEKDKYNEIRSNYLSNGWLNEDAINKEYTACQSSNNSSQNDLMIVMQKYSTNYKPALIPTIDNLKDFVNEYYKLLNWDVVKFQQQAKEAYERAESSFREDFLSKLKEKIETSQKMIDKLNKNLQSHPFGNDEERYKFFYEPTKDSELRNYYKIIMSGKLMESKDLFTEILDEKDASFIKDLFDKISMETDSVEAEKELSRYLDYRNYMSYDIKITNKHGDESYFSKINKEKSGGETQTPFYIVMASCFDELMSKDGKVESTCQVVFDEAFNNMDESRIKSLMEFYKNLNIQILIVVPSNRIAPISPYMDTLVGITKINDHPHISTIGK